MKSLFGNTGLRIPKKVIGISLDISDKANVSGTYCTLKRSKKSVEIESTGKLDSMDQISKLQKEIKAPIVFNLFGRSIISKRASIKEPLTDEQALNFALPNSDIDQFFVQQLTYTNSNIVSMIRKELLVDLIESWTKNKIEFIEISLGNSPLSILKKLGVVDSSSISSTAGSIDFELEDVNIGEGNLQATYSIGSDQLTTDQTLPYSIALQNLVATDHVNISAPEFAHINQEYFQKKQFNNLLIGGLSFVFVILLINMLVNSSLSDKNQRLQEQHAINSSTLDDLSSLELEYENKEMQLKKAGWLKSPKSSFYHDRIASCVPKDVSLSLLEYQPYDVQSSRHNGKSIYKKNIIAIKGYTKSAVSLNPWISVLKDRDWIKNVKVEDYAYDSRKKNWSFELKVEI